MQGKYRIGIDLGGTNIVAGIVDSEYNIIVKKSVPTNLPKSCEEICADMARLSFEVTDEASLSFADDIASIGIGSPGIIADGTVIRADNLKFSNAPLTEIMKKLTGKDVFLKNDADAAAYGEFVAGAGKGKSNLVAITLGTGVGGGVIVDKKIVSGIGGAGEVGHFVIRAGGRQCACGRSGCFEAYCSASALIRSTAEAMEADPASKLWEIAGDISRVNGKTAFDGLRLGDQTAIKVVDSFISDLATGVSNMINLLQPEVICIGGGICKEGETLLSPLRKLVEAQTYSVGDKRTQIVRATLGNDAGIIGAAAE